MQESDRNFRESEVAAGLNSIPHLDPSAILVAEFEYIAQTAFQANEDRSRVSTLYLATAGSLIAAVLAVQLERLNQIPTFWAFSSLFFVLSISSLLAILQLVQLRKAWFESVCAMNRIKEYFALHSGKIGLSSAFLWNKLSLPQKNKRGSIAFILVLQVAVLGGICLGATVFFIGLIITGNQYWWTMSSICGLIYGFLLIVVYDKAVVM